MSSQIAVRLPEELVEFVDELVRSGQAKSRAEVVTKALSRELRRQSAARDAALLAGSKRPNDLERLAEFVRQTPLDLD